MKKDHNENIVFTKRIELNVDGRFLALIYLNRPDDMNPLSWEVLRKLEDALKETASDDTVRVIAITGKGKAFSAGGDLKAYQTLQKDKVEFPKFLQHIHRVFNYIEEIRKPVIGLINGFCVAGGIELLLSCDFSYAAESARIGDGHINFGQMGGGGVLGRICRRMYPQRARELLFSGRLLTAQEALDWGLVNKVVADEMLIEEAVAFANLVTKKSSLALGNMKEVVNKAIKMREEDSLMLEQRVCHHYCLTSFDASEGLASFAQKREADYRGS